MSNTLRNTVSYELYIQVKNANPNGDPMNEGRPRMDDDGIGWMSDKCLKHKIRMAAAQIIAENPEKYDPGKYDIYYNAEDGLTKVEKLIKVAGENAGISEAAAAVLSRCWDTRVFGHLVNPQGGESAKIGAAVSVSRAFTVDRIDDCILEEQFTSSLPYGESKATKKKGSESKETVTGKMGLTALVKNALYRSTIALNPRACERNGVTDLDLELFEEALCYMFCDDFSNTRTANSMYIDKLIKVSYPKPRCLRYLTSEAVLGEDGKTYTYSIDREKAEKQGCKIEEVI